MVGIVLFALGFVGGEAGVGHGSPVSGSAASRFGLYPGYAGVAELRSLERFVGHPANYVVQFADIHESAFTSSVWGEVTQAGAFQTIANQVTLVESIPLAFGDFIEARTPAGQATARANLQATVDGAHDGDYRVAANYLRNGGYPDAIIRLGWEFDGDWMPWSARGNEALWITAYQHVADIFRSVSPSFRFDWNGTAGFLQDDIAAYPGNDYVDVVGLDVYDKGLPTLWDSATQGWLDPAQAFGTLRDDLAAQRDFAIAHGKPVSFPEWALTGVDGNVTSDVGGDDPAFIQGMSDWINGLPADGPGSLSYQSYFNEDTEDGHHRIDANYFPDSAARYKFLFGADPATPDPTTPDPTLPDPTLPDPTTPVISLSAASDLVQGQSIVLTTKAWAPDAASSEVSGTVSFFDGWNGIGEAILDNGVATLTTKVLTPGKHVIWVLYWGSGDAKPAISPRVKQIVRPASTTVHAPSVSGAVGETIPLQTSVSVQSPGTGTPTGLVVYTDSATGRHYGVGLQAGTAELALDGLPVGAHAFTATYLGASGYDPATADLTVTVNPQP